MNKFTLGCDPELFLADATNRLKASCGLIGGTKEHPQPLEELGVGFAVQEDNVAIEFNIPPASDKHAFAHSIARTIKYINDGVNDTLGLHLVTDLSAASFPEEELAAPAAKVFGCDPDFNAWTMKRNPRPKASDPNLRACGGHVHVGYDVMKAEFGPTYLIRLMDLYLGVPSVLMDKGELRKELYGKAGAYREKVYGVEYRTLSNFWVKHPRLSEWVWDNTARAFAAADAEFPVGEDKDAILDAINNNNKEVAQMLVEKHKLEVLYV
jgi:hypothetical protein